MWLLERWFGSSAAPKALVGAFALSILLALATTAGVRRRLATVNVLLLVYLAFELAAYGVGGSPTIFGLLDGAASLVASIALARLVFVVAIDLIWERGGRAPANQLLRDLIQGALLAFAIFGALGALGVRATALIATGTVVTAIVGLAMQETLGNLAAGVAINVDRPFGVGDWVRLDRGDVVGRVVSTNWRSITIEGDDRLYVVVPNNHFSRTPFTNFSRPGGAFRRGLYFVVGYDVSPSRVESAARAACADAPGVLLDPPASVVTWAFLDHGVQYWVRFFIDDFAARDRILGEVQRRLWYQLTRQKISFAVPVRNVSVQQDDAADRSRAAVSDRRAAVDAVDFLQPLSDASRDEIARRARRLRFGPGETVIHRGDAGRELYVVRSGSVSVRGKQATHLGPGQFFGERSLLTGEPRAADVVADVETELLAIDEPCFRDVLHRNPEVIAHVSAVVAARGNGASDEPENANSDQIEAPTGNLLSRIRAAFGLE